MEDGLLAPMEVLLQSEHRSAGVPVVVLEGAARGPIAGGTKNLKHQ